MRCGTLLACALLAGCGHGARADPGVPSTSVSAVAYRGVSLAAPGGWVGQALRGRLQIQDYPGTGDPPAGHVLAVVDEFSAAGAGDFAYAPLDGPLTARPGQYPSAAFAGEADPGPGLAGAAEFFSESGRRFELLVVYGGDHPPASTVDALNGVLATLRVQPGDFYDAMLTPPVFAPADGWYVGGDAATRERPEGDQLCAWASTVPYRDPHACPIPAHTIDALPAGGMVISVDVFRSWQRLRGPSLAGRLTLPARLGPVQEGGRRSFDITGTVDGVTEADISVYVAMDATPTEAMRDRAQAMLDRLTLPTWPP